MTVRLLTEEQKDQLINKECYSGVMFYPIQDNLGNWIISNEEVNNYDGSEFNWIASLPIIEYEPIILDNTDLDI